MILSDKEVSRLKKLLSEIDQGFTKKRVKPYVTNRTRNIRLMLSKAERREKTHCYEREKRKQEETHTDGST